MQKPVSLVLAEHVRQIYRVIADEGLTVEDIKRPDYWVHVAARLRPGDRIEVEAEDGLWFAELYVRAASRMEAIVDVLRVCPLGPDGKPAEVAESLYRVQFKGPKKLHCIIRNSDDVIVTEGISTKEAALHKAQNMVAAQAR